jgi:RNA polymerase sigma-70 factor (ECF subfamily)
MNILGHENPGAPHMSDERGRVEGALTSPAPQTEASATPHAADTAILLALGESRERAAALLVSEHGLAVGRLCMALLGRQGEAEDALQETLLAALDGLEKFRGEGTLRAWLFSIARRRCARQLSERSREREAKQELGSASMTVTTPAAERLSTARRARSLLEKIRPSEREALVLRFAGELSFREIAEICNIDEAAARKRVSRGLTRLRMLFGEDES